MIASTSHPAVCLAESWQNFLQQVTITPGLIIHIYIDIIGYKLGSFHVSASRILAVRQSKTPNCTLLQLLPIIIEHTIDERSPLCGHTFDTLQEVTRLSGYASRFLNDSRSYSAVLNIISCLEVESNSYSSSCQTPNLFPMRTEGFERLSASKFINSFGLAPALCIL